MLSGRRIVQSRLPEIYGGSKLKVYIMRICELQPNYFILLLYTFINVFLVSLQVPQVTSPCFSCEPPHTTRKQASLEEAGGVVSIGERSRGNIYQTDRIYTNNIVTIYIVWNGA